MARKKQLVSLTQLKSNNCKNDRTKQLKRGKNSTGFRAFAPFQVNAFPKWNVTTINHYKFNLRTPCFVSTNDIEIVLGNIDNKLAYLTPNKCDYGVDYFTTLYSC